jgi:hypothetical protein
MRQGGSMLFSQRDPVVWGSAKGKLRSCLPALHGMNDRFVALVVGVVSSQVAAEAIHSEIVRTTVNKRRAPGHLSHEAYFRVGEPGSPESREFTAVDAWWDLAGTRRTWEAPTFSQALAAWGARGQW